jgi:hypothetical protein
MFGRKKKAEPPKRTGQVDLEGKSSGAYLIASTETASISAQSRIRGRLQEAKLIEASVNPATAVKMPVGAVSGYEYPDDFNDFQDYIDAYYYIPYVARAIDIKQFMIWQMGYDLECDDEPSKKRLTDFLTKIQADTVIRDGNLFALLFGNMYWKIQKDKKDFLRPLNPIGMGLKLDSESVVTEYRYEVKMGKVDRFKPEEILHLKFNAEPWSLFGVSTLRRVLPTVKALLFMEEKLPWIARRRADPLLLVNIGAKDGQVDDESYKRIKDSIINRKPGEDIFNQNQIIESVQEIYQSASVGGRQTVEPIIAHFVRNLVAGLGVPEPALGFGGTTTMATADYQERILHSEIRAYQRALKRLHESVIFPLEKTSTPVKLIWRPLTEEDKATLSKTLQGEVEHAIVSPEFARKRLGYPDDARKGVVIDSRLVPTTVASEAAHQERHCDSSKHQS